jgi:hypothetical protein
MPGPPLTESERRKVWPWLANDKQARELETWLRERDDAYLTGQEPPPGPPWPEKLPFEP